MASVTVSKSLKVRVAGFAAHHQVHLRKKRIHVRMEEWTMLLSIVRETHKTQWENPSRFAFRMMVKKRMAMRSSRGSSVWWFFARLIHLFLGAKRWCALVVEFVPFPVIDLYKE
jgi:hypothetical protein